MRSIVVVLAGWLVATASSLALADDPPIPQDPGFMKQRGQEWLTWNRQTLGDFYKTSSKRSPRWDKQAERALELAAQMYSLQTDPFVSFADLHAASREAVTAGCDDPLILYIYAQTSTIPNFPGDEEFTRRLQRASDALLASNCSPFRKSVALLRITQIQRSKAGKQPTPDQIKAVEANLDGLFDLLSQSVKTDPRGEFWEARWHDNLTRILGEYQILARDFKAGFDRFDARLAKIPGTEGMRLTIKGGFYVDWGWQGRGDSFAGGVSEKQFDTFHERLVAARAALMAAYKLNPKQPNVARIMIDVEKGDGDGDRATMELWFRRALELDPYDQAACVGKLNWLEPKWHGDPEGKEMLAFGKACAATNNWITGITLLSATAITNYAACTMPANEQFQFFARPENWNPIAAVYDEYLKHYPYEALALSKYAFLAYSAGRAGISHQMFQRVGDNLTAWSGSTFVTMDSLRRARDLVARAVEDLKKKKAGQK